MSSYRPGQVAELLGVSVDTVRRWCDEGRLQTTRSEGRHRVIAGSDLARHLAESEQAYEPDSLIPEFLIKRAGKTVIDAGTEGLRKRVLGR